MGTTTARRTDEMAGAKALALAASLAVPLWLLLSLLGGARTASAAGPTAQEQLFLYEVNRARVDPTGWALEMGIAGQTGGDGQPADLDEIVPQPPLALNEALVGSARFHATEMAANDYFAHQSAVTNKWPNEMARDAGYPLVSSFPDDQNQIESIACGFGPGNELGQALNAVKQLIVDAGVPSLGHRLHLLGQGAFGIFVEAASGFGSNTAASCVNYWAFHTGVKDQMEVFLTGVVFADANANQLYDPGEGLGGVTVRAAGASVLTNAAGGWSIAVPDGTHSVEAEGGAFGPAVGLPVTVAGVNREVDFVAGASQAFVDFEPVPVPEPGPLAAALAGLTGLGLAAGRRRAAARARSVPG